MNYLSKCATRVATGIFAVGFALSLAPMGQAQSSVQAAADSSASTSAAPATSTQQQLDDLQKEMNALQQQIAALKAQQDAAPSVQAASFVQTPAAAPADSKVTLAGLLGPTTISGMGDVYYGYNYNHPNDNQSGFRFFDGPTNGFGFNMAELIVDKAPDATSTDSRLGYHIAAGYGNAADIINCTDPAGVTPSFAGSGDDSTCSNFYLKEAYGSYLAPIGKGLTIQVGKFVTPVGNEVIETNGNWNYSRGLLFYYAIPYFHFGVNAKYTWNPKISADVYVVNGWNNSVIDNDDDGFQSSGLTYGLSLAYTPNAKWAVTENYFAGPVTDFYAEEHSEDNFTPVNDWKQLSDTIVSYTPNAKWAFALNGDYAFGPKSYTEDEETCTPETGATVHPAALPAGVCQVGPQETYWGVAGYGKYTLSPKAYFAARYEYFDDPQGYAGLLTDRQIDVSEGPGWAQEATGTYAYNLTSGLQIRAEYRYDFASKPLFQVGNNFDHIVKEQNTATVGFIYSFSSANAK
jgi:hypothetical protein